MTTPRGPVMLDVAGLDLDAEDRRRIAHPLVGGVILFVRNYESPRQLKALTDGIRASRDPAPLIGVDHEGGRVQRFRDGFSGVPAMRTLGETWDRDADLAIADAERWGGIIGAELAAQGIDFSFTPVLDLDYGKSAVIGDRAFHREPGAVSDLASALCKGLALRGVAAVGKHFPGHGFVRGDSHHEIPIDERPLSALERDDLLPFGALIARRRLQAIMPAHVVYPSIDDVPAGFSRVWLRDILRQRLGFDGMIFSDDLSMAGAHGAGDIVARADAALAAGCDMVLVCNDSAAADDLLARWHPPSNPQLARRARAMERRLS